MTGPVSTMKHSVQIRLSITLGRASAVRFFLKNYSNSEKNSQNKLIKASSFLNLDPAPLRNSVNEASNRQSRSRTPVKNTSGNGGDLKAKLQDVLGPYNNEEQSKLF